MGAVWLCARSGWRARGRWLLAVTLLAGVAGAVTLASAAGWRRSSTSFERLLVATSTPNIDVQFETRPEADLLRRLAEVPGVIGVTNVSFMAVAVEGRGQYPGKDTIGLAIIGAFGDTPVRPLTSAGRPARPERPDEITVNQAMVDAFDLHVGEHLVLATATPEQAEQSFGGEDPGPPAGPLVPVRVVGVTRDAEEVADAPDPVLFVTPGFHRRYAGEVGSYDGISGVTAQPGRVDEALAEVRRLAPEADVQRSEDLGPHIQDGIDVQAAGLLVLASVAALAGIVLLAQAIVRRAQVEATEDAIGVALGLTRGQLSGIAVLRAIPVAFGGAAFAVVVGTVLAPRMVTGLARDAEPDPGMWVDLPVAVAVAAAIVVVVLLSAVGAARWAPRRVVAGRRLRPSATGQAAAAVGLPLAPTIGVRYALEPGAGRSAVPARPALVAAVIGVVGVVASLTFIGAVDHLFATPRLWGATFDAIVEAPEEGPGREQVADRLRADPTVAAVATSPEIPARARDDAGGEVATSVSHHDVLKGDLGPTLLEGRAPLAVGEASFGSGVLTDIGAEVGDVVPIEIGEDRLRLEVVGRHVSYGIDRVDQTVVVSTDGFAPFRADAEPGPFEVRFVDRSDTDTTRAALAEVLDLEDSPPPSSIDNLDELGSVPAVLAGSMALLALLSGAHLLASGLRRRRRELAVLRTFGMFDAQLRSIIVWQAVTVALVGVIIGVPLGLALGRTVYRSVADDLGVVPDVGLAGTAVAVAAVSIVVVAALLSRAVAAVTVRTRTTVLALRPE